MSRFTLRTLAAVSAAALTLTLGACSSDSSDNAATTTSTATSTATSTTAKEVSGDKITFTNCGHNFELDGVPQKVMLVNRAGVVPTLDAVGALDNVHVRAGAFPEEYFDAEINAKLKEIPSLTEKMDGSGHLQITKEEIVGTDSDLIIGYAGSTNWDAMQGTGIPIIEMPGFCKALGGDADWKHVWQDIDFYGNLFQEPEKAANYAKELQQRLEEAKKKQPGKGLKVAVLYPSTDGSINYAYGRSSMSHPIIEAAGLENVFADQTDRVFEVNDEELISRNPDVIISLYSEGGEASKQRAIDGVTAISGVNQTNAGKNGKILPMLLYFAEPPSSLNLDALDQLIEFLEK